MKTNDKLRGTAFHEAGHVIMARELGLRVGEIAIGIDGEVNGRTDIASAQHLPLIDQIALCVSGVVAQLLFDWPRHNIAGADDYTRVVQLVVGMSNTKGRKMRNAGWTCSRAILERRATEVERLADQLLHQRRIDAS